MNNCELYQELISRLIDGELSREEAAALDTHMENCAECSAMYAVFASLSDIIGGEDEPLPEDLHENIMAGVRRSAMISHNRRRLSRPVRNMLTAAACAALVLFASRGLAPEKAADTVLNADQAAVMDARVQQALPASEDAALPVESPAAEEAPAAPAPSAEPEVSPVPTKDIYLESQKNEAKPAATNTPKPANSVMVTPRPTEIPVYTPVAVTTPQPTPTPKPTPKPTASPAPAATAAPAVTEVPAASASPAAASAEPEMDAVPLPANGGTEHEKDVPAAYSADVSAVTAAVDAPVETEAASAEPVETETPSFSSRILSFFSLRKTEPETEAAPAAPAEAAELTESAAGTAEPVVQESREEEAEAEEDTPIKLESLEKLTVLEDMLDGIEAELPETEPLEEYSFVLAEPEEWLEDYKIIVYLYEETVYYEQIFSEEESIICVSECSVEDFGEFMDSLSDSEKGIEPDAKEQPTASPAVTAAPTASPAAASAAPAESPAASQSPAK